MPFYEVIYETGAKSVVFNDTDAATLDALRAHHNRALTGEAGSPTGAPAERVKRVLVYDKHPNEHNPAQTMSAEVVKKELDALVKVFTDDNGVVAVDRLAMAVRNLTSPLNDTAGAHESQYKMEEARELELDFA